MDIDLKMINKNPLTLAEHCTGGKYKIPPHIEYMNDKVMLLNDRKIKRLMINMPPRHGKSEYISKYFPFWYLGKHPDHRIILASYQQRMASSFGRRVLELVNEFGEPLFGIKANSKNKSSASFGIEGNSGEMISVGVGGPLTGKGADLLIIDDPVKNDKEAGSIVIRDNIWDWYRSTAFSRLEPEGIIVLLMTRWNEDDLCGRILSLDENFDEFDEEKWEQINFPAIAEDDDLLGRKCGDALWSERFPAARLNRIKKTIGSYWFSALYQQRPNPAGGGVYKKINFRYYSSDEKNYYLHSHDGENISIKSIGREFCAVYACADLAVSAKESSDYTAVLVFALTPDKDVVILDVIREKFEATQHLPMLKQIFSKYGTSNIGIEATQYQMALVQSALAEGLPVHSLKPDKSKFSRALPMAGFLEQGKVYFPKHSSWLNDFEEELVLFPNGKHDDMADAFAYILYMINIHSGRLPVGAGRKNSIRSEILSM